uniref:Uncharacterized protein n=1 Tax=Coccolithus braarudii TaxID=221442 RepID=A0A7S0Q7A5_9EUKA
MPHGDFSDFAALFSAAVGLSSIFAPQLWFESVGPLKPMFDSPATVEAQAVVRFVGGLFMFMAPVLYVVRWNVLNGKAGALGCLIAAANTVHLALSLDGFAFEPRGWYVIAVALTLTALHLAFNANPMLTSAMLLEQEKRKADKAAAKAKAK